MSLKKSMLGQYETSFLTKKLQVPLLTKGIPTNPDVIASGIKEAISMLPENAAKGHEVTLVLPQESFIFLKTDKPADIADNVLSSYLKEKVRTEKTFDIESGHSNYLIRENEGIKKVSFYGMLNETVDSYEAPLKLIELSLVGIIPESLTYFKLFEKTLRSNKKENIWYVSYENDELRGYAYDSYGLIGDSRWTASLSTSKKIEKVLQKKAASYEEDGTKLNRLILSGAQSESIRQDTFTKDVGVWTNPIKRIIPHFYSDYLKMLGGQDNKEIPILEYDMLLGAFIFTAENKSFSLMNAPRSKKKSRFSAPSFSLPSLNMKGSMKSVLFAIGAFLVTFGVLYGTSKFDRKILILSPTPTTAPSPTPQPPTPTPTPEVIRANFRVSVLNGSGIVGKASKVKDFLRTKEYEEVLTGNAQAFDYETTVIQTKEGDERLRDTVAQDIASEITGKPEFETLDADDAADIVIIVGTDFR